VSQPWGGTGYGGVNLPRIGQEVLVDFLGGDPDRPVIVGRVYTNLQKVPYQLPDNRTQSGWKSNSTNQTGGYNELMFEDAAGKELLRMRAELDEEHAVGRDRTRQVNRDESVTVGNDRHHQVGQTERINVGQNQSISVGVNRTAQIGNNDTTIVGVQAMLMISPPGEGPVEGASSWTLTKDKIVLDTGNGARIEMDKDVIRIVADDLVEIWGKKRGVNVHAPAAGGKTNVFSGDEFTVNCKTVRIMGQETVVSGADKVEITGGKIGINGAPIDIASDGKIQIEGEPVNIGSDSTIEIAGKIVDIRGAPIKLNS
jgi:type VI secretion system secreted protein VgrG